MSRTYRRRKDNNSNKKSWKYYISLNPREHNKDNIFWHSWFNPMSEESALSQIIKRYNNDTEKHEKFIFEWYNSDKYRSDINSKKRKMCRKFTKSAIRLETQKIIKDFKTEKEIEYVNKPFNKYHNIFEYY